MPCLATQAPRHAEHARSLNVSCGTWHSAASHDLLYSRNETNFQSIKETTQHLRERKKKSKELQSLSDSSPSKTAIRFNPSRRWRTPCCARTLIATTMTRTAASPGCARSRVALCPDCAVFPLASGMVSCTKGIDMQGRDLPHEDKRYIYEESKHEASALAHDLMRKEVTPHYSSLIALMRIHVYMQASNGIGTHTHASERPLRRVRFIRL
jgi:hypothetical protein